MTGAHLRDRVAAALSDRYRVEGELGHGATAVVYLATDLKHDRRVALKVLRPELAAAVGPDRFLAEIRTTANLQHPHILPLFDSGEADGFLYYVMPWVEGESLRARLDRDGALPEDEALAIGNDVASALSRAHRAGIVHRDIKPENVLLSAGEALVADFGVALALKELGPERRTAAGVSVGTPWYMSPEQIDGQQEVDARSDVYALGCLLFEMLTGTRPFESPTLQGVLTKVLTQAPPEVRDRRPEIRSDLSRAVQRAMAKDPGHRFASAAAFLAACSPPAGQASRRRGLVAVLAVSVVAVGVAAWVSWRDAQRAEARAMLPEATRLVAEGRYLEAYGLAVAAERWLPHDSTLAGLLVATSDELSVTTTPAGAEVFLQPFDPDTSRIPPEESIGTTPVAGFRLPRGSHRIVVRLDGFVAAERVVSSELQREWTRPEEGRRLVVDLDLVRSGAAPEGMVPVPGGPYRLTSPDAPSGDTVLLEPFFIHRFEVTNEDYAAFVRSGGYSASGYWDPLPESVRARLVDRTGLPGPRDWSRQRYPDGADRLPVTGVTWWEAQAFCRTRGGRLPTLFEWEKTARDGRYARFGVLMPWGIERASGEGELRANFNSHGPNPVDALPFGIGPYGTYGMAGNVREWTLNAFGDGRAITGGSWDGPSYLYAQYASEPPHFTSPALGFRCVVFDGSGDQGGAGIDLDLAPPVWTPVDRTTFESFLAFYRYDPIEPNPRLTERKGTPDWFRERIWIDGPEGDSILLYFWAPRSSNPPYQTVVSVPGTNVFFTRTVPNQTEATIGPVIQAGRAVMAVVMEGMVERNWPAGTGFPEPSSVGFRDLMIRHSTELRLALDYLETREDVDPQALAYLGTSWGAGSRLPFAAVDDRYRAVVLLGAGIDERMKPTLPEVDNVNFAPYIDAPTLVVNGANDEEHTWLHRAAPLWELLSEPKELERVEGAGHLVPMEDRIPPINRFLDRVLGPVRR